MKRYMLFIGEDYYPDRGMGDFVSDFDSIEEANKRIEEIKMTPNYQKALPSVYDIEYVFNEYDNWVIIYDSVDRCNVYESDPI